MQQSGVLALFEYLDDFTGAIEKIRGRADFAEHELYSPSSYHEIEHAANYPTSPVRYFTLAGGLTGTVTGFGLALVMDADWPMIVGGKMGAFYSLPAYVILGFELTILFGAIMTIGGMLIMGRIPNWKVNVLDERLTNDRFGIFVPGVGENSDQVAVLKECGAGEIKLVGDQ